MVHSGSCSSGSIRRRRRRRRRLLRYYGTYTARRRVFSHFSFFFPAFAISVDIAPSGRNARLHYTLSVAEIKPRLRDFNTRSVVGTTREKLEPRSVYTLLYHV